MLYFEREECMCVWGGCVRACVYLQHSYIRHIHNEGQRHIIVHTGLTTDFESFHVQQVNHAWYLRVLFKCFCLFTSLHHWLPSYRHMASPTISILMTHSSISHFDQMIQR